MEEGSRDLHCIASHSPVSNLGNSTQLTKSAAPAQDAIDYKLAKFQSSIYDGKTEYQGPPTKTNNRLWADLYRSA